MADVCYWCHEPLPPLPEDATYVDEINHYIHDECRDTHRTTTGRQGLTTNVTNVSEVTGEREAVNISTVQLSDGSVLFLLGVAPIDEAQTYFNTFGRVRAVGAVERQRALDHQWLAR